MLNYLSPFLLHFKSGAVVQKCIQIIPHDILGIGLQEEVDVEALRGRLRKMSDAELLGSGKAARFMCSPGAQLRKGAARVFCDSVEGSKSGVEAEE